MHTRSQANASSPTPKLGLTTGTHSATAPTAAPAMPLPLLLDAEGVRKYLAPIGRTLLFQLAARGEIESASLGLSRGKRVFVTASVVQWLERRMAGTVRPKIMERGMGTGKGQGQGQGETARQQGGGVDE